MNPMGGLVGGQEGKKMKLPLFTRSSNPTRSQAKRGGGIEQLRVGERSKNPNNSKKCVVGSYHNYSAICKIESRLASVTVLVMRCSDKHAVVCELKAYAVRVQKLK